MTAPSLSLPAGTLVAAWQQVRAAVPLRTLAAGAPVLAVAVFSQLLNSGPRVTLDPAVPLFVAVVGGALLGGLRGGMLAAAIAVGYGLFFYAQPHSVGVPGNGLRVLLFAAGAVALGAVAGVQRDRMERSAAAAASTRQLVARARQFSEALGQTPPEGLASAIVSRAPAMIGADMAALTVVELRTGRHVVRAVRGTSQSAIGVEVLPGVGLAGQAIRDHRTVVVGRALVQPTTAELLRDRLMSWIDGRQPAPLQQVEAATPRVAPAISLPQMHGGSVVATLTLGRADVDRPFTDDERQLLELISPHVALAVANGLLRGQLREASLKDALTGLYNRSYLDAALDQQLALRRRTPAETRPSLSLILFDIDGFHEINERHGKNVGDQVLRAVAALLQQRFRASDTIARVGCDGFVVVLEGADLKAAVEAAGQIRSQLRSMSLTDERGAPLAVSISAGCALFRDEVARSEQIVRTVEAALDTARWSGPGAVVAI